MPKYRRKVLIGEVAKRLEKLLYEKAAEFDFKIHTLEIMPDHVHILLEHDPTICVAEVVNRFKGYTVESCAGNFPNCAANCLRFGAKLLCGSIGSVTEAAIRTYIEIKREVSAQTLQTRTFYRHDSRMQT